MALLSQAVIRDLITLLQSKICAVPNTAGQKKKNQNAARQAAHRAGKTRVCKWK